MGTERLERLIHWELSSGLDAILTRAEQAAHEFRAGAEAADDATMVLVKIGEDESHVQTQAA